MARRVDINNGDFQARRHLVRTLKATREQLGITQAELAADMWLTNAAISRFERHEPPNPHISVVQRYALGLSRTIRFRLEGLPAVDLGPQGDLLARLAQSTRPDKAEGARRSLVLAELVAARRALGLSLGDVASAMGTDRCALFHIEAETYEPLLSTYQRYARAMGGRLTFRLQVADIVDEVRIRRTLAGDGGGLNRTERVEATRRLLRAGVGPGMVACRLGVSGTEGVDLVSLAAEDVAA